MNAKANSLVYMYLAGLASRVRDRGVIEPREDAEAFIKTMDECGFVIVPREPTEEIFAAGGECKPFGDPIPDWQPKQIIAGSVWRAMVAEATR